MTRTRLLVRLSLITAAWFAPGERAAVAAPSAFRMITLGVFSEEAEFPGGTARAVSDGLLAVGELNAYSGDQWIGSRAARWSDFDAPLNQGDLLNITSSFSGSIARDVNESGVSVGSSRGRLTGISGAPNEAVWWGDGQTLPNRLPRAESGPAPSQSTANAINESGVVVGETRYILDGSWDALVWPSLASEPIPLPDTTDGGANVLARTARDVNDSGLIVGYGEVSPRNPGDPLFLPMVWDANDNYTPTVLPFDARLPANRRGALLNAINASGQIAGQATVWDEEEGRGVGSAVRWNSLSEPPEALQHAPLAGSDVSGNIAQDINDAGVVVGYTWDGDRTYRGVLWDEDAEYRFLDDLLIDAPGVSVLRVYGVNNDGWVAGIASTPDGARAVLLMPVPEPSSAALLLLTAMAAVRRRRQRPSGWRGRSAKRKPPGPERAD